MASLDEEGMEVACFAEVVMEVACEAEVVHKTSDRDMAMDFLVSEQVGSQKQVRKEVLQHDYEDLEACDESFHVHPMNYLEDNT